MGSSLTALLLVFGLLGALLFWARRAAGGATAGGALQVVDAVQLGSGRSVAVLRSGGRYFLIGATPHAIALIAELAAADVAAASPSAAGPASWPGWPRLAAKMRPVRKVRVADGLGGRTP
jgi:flagellar biogenesis protein FliO